MSERVDLAFVHPAFLWLLVVPALLLLACAWQLIRRRADARRTAATQVVPTRGKYVAVGDLAFWAALTLAAASCIVALAHPQMLVWRPGAGGADFVILQDASASMYVRDVAPDRWRRSMRFVRTFADTLSWEHDRVALALFAYFTAPQLRLTRDPESLFFFLDHLSERPPFRLEDDPTWNTNIEEAIAWGLQLVDTDAQLFGRNNNPKAFIVISDGQAWTGKVATALAAARTANVSISVVGVGTALGGYIPASASSARLSSLYSSLDRSSLRTIANAGRGSYFELDRQSDRDIAARIINDVHSRAPATSREERREDLYWRFLVAAGLMLLPAMLFVRHRSELWWQAAAAAAALVILTRLSG